MGNNRCKKQAILRRRLEKRFETRERLRAEVNHWNFINSRRETFRRLIKEIINFQFTKPLPNYITGNTFCNWYELSKFVLSCQLGKLKKVSFFVFGLKRTTTIANIIPSFLCAEKAQQENKVIINKEKEEFQKLLEKLDSYKLKAIPLRQSYEKQERRESYRSLQRGCNAGRFAYSLQSYSRKEVERNRETRESLFNSSEYLEYFNNLSLKKKDALLELIRKAKKQAKKQEKKEKQAKTEVTQEAKQEAKQQETRIFIFTGNSRFSGKSVKIGKRKYNGVYMQTSRASVESIPEDTPEVILLKKEVFKINSAPLGAQ